MSSESDRSRDDRSWISHVVDPERGTRQQMSVEDDESSENASSDDFPEITRGGDSAEEVADVE